MVGTSTVSDHMLTNVQGVQKIVVSQRVTPFHLDAACVNAHIREYFGSPRAAPKDERLPLLDLRFTEPNLTQELSPWAIPVPEMPEMHHVVIKVETITMPHGCMQSATN